MKTKILLILSFLMLFGCTKDDTKQNNTISSDNSAVTIDNETRKLSELEEQIQQIKADNLSARMNSNWINQVVEDYQNLNKKYDDLQAKYDKIVLWMELINTQLWWDLTSSQAIRDKQAEIKTESWESNNALSNSIISNQRSLLSKILTWEDKATFDAFDQDVFTTTYINNLQGIWINTNEELIELLKQDNNDRYFDMLIKTLNDLWIKASLDIFKKN